MKRLICYLKTIQDWKVFLMALWNFNAIYINHEYYDQKSYFKGNTMYYPIKCRVCGNVSIAWRVFR